MNREETRLILRMLQSAYPQRYKGMSKGDVEKLLDQWTLPEPFAVVKSAVQAAINTMTFHPSIAEIKSLMQVPPIAEEEDMRSAFKSMLRFRLRQMEQFEKPPEEITAFKNRYAEFLEDTP